MSSKELYVQMHLTSKLFGTTIPTNKASGGGSSQDTHAQLRPEKVFLSGGHPNGKHWELMCVRFSLILILNLCKKSGCRFSCGRRKILTVFLCTRI